MEPPDGDVAMAPRTAGLAAAWNSAGPTSTAQERRSSSEYVSPDKVLDAKLMTIFRQVSRFCKLGGGADGRLLRDICRPVPIIPTPSRLRCTVKGGRH